MCSCFQNFRKANLMEFSFVPCRWLLEKQPAALWNTAAEICHKLLCCLVRLNRAPSIGTSSFNFLISKHICARAGQMLQEVGKPQQHAECSISWLIEMRAGAMRLLSTLLLAVSKAPAVIWQDCTPRAS